jgi:hypothetical protein
MAGKPIKLTLSAMRAELLAFRARQLGVAPAALARSFVEAGMDRLMADERFLQAWERDCMTRDQVAAFERMTGRKVSE